MEMCEGLNKKFVFTGVSFRPGLILVDSSTEDKADRVRTIVLKLSGLRVRNCRHVLGIRTHGDATFFKSRSD